MMAWFPVRVAGSSMSPTLEDGDLLGARALRDGEPRVRQIVVARTSAREVVKRVVSAAPRTVTLAGDNISESTDPGAVARAHIAGIVRFRYWPLWRARIF